VTIFINDVIVIFDNLEYKGKLVCFLWITLNHYLLEFRSKVCESCCFCGLN